MPFSTASEVPDNVPLKYKPQFMEIWNSAYAAAIVDKKSPDQASETAYTQAHGVINKAKTKDENDARDGGQAADPTASLRFSEDQPRDKDGKFGSGSSTSPHESEAVKAAGASGTAKDGDKVLSKEEHDKQYEASYTKTMNDLNAKKDSGVSSNPNAAGRASSVETYHKIFEPKASELTVDNARKEGALAAWSAHRTSIMKYA